MPNTMSPPQLEGLDDITDEMIQAAIETKRAVYKQHYTQYNYNTIRRHYEPEEILFISGYAPVAIVETDSYAVTFASRNPDILSIESVDMDAEYYADNTMGDDATIADIYYDKIIDGIDLANTISRADVVRDSKNLTGSGVKIGILEAYGIPDITSPYLCNANITIRPDDLLVADHATIVASILVSKESDGTVHGIVPDAELYCCCTSTSSIFGCIEWLIDNGVNVINASLGSRYDYGYYDPVSRWVDHIAIQHDVHFVNSAGNYNENNTYYVTSPAMAYNAISVGNFDARGSDDITRFSMYSSYSSCYEEYPADTDSARAEKPNLVAGGCFADAAITTEGEIVDLGGTSFAAPQVAGVIAQLCDHTSGLKTKQTQIGAILAASSARKVDAVGTGEKGDIFTSSVRVEGNTQISNKEGAGILDARWAWGVVANHNHWSVTLADSDDLPYTKTVTIDTSKNTLTRVAIFWLKRNTVTNHTSSSVDYTTYPLANLDLYIYGPDGSLIYWSKLTYANFEIVQFIPPTTGEYSIVITGSTNGRTNIGISVW